MKRNVYFLLILLVGSLLTQGFQCASVEMSTAREALDTKFHAPDYDKAKKSLDIEVQKNPTNPEAWYYLSFLYKEGLSDDVNAVKAIKNADKNITATTDPTLKRKIKLMKEKLGDFFTKAGSSNLDKFSSLQDKDALNEAVDNFKKAQELNPDENSILISLGQCSEYSGDTTKAIEYYEKYMTIQKSNFDFLEKTGITLGAKLSEFKSKLGEPTKYVRFSSGDDSVLTAVSKKDGKDVYAYFSAKKTSECWKDAKATPSKGNVDDCFTMYGLKYDSQLAEESDKTFPQSISFAPLEALTFLYYYTGKKDLAMQYLNKTIALEPNNASLYSLKIQMLSDEGKAGEASKMLLDLIQKNPNNKMYISQYANVLATDAQALSVNKDIPNSLKKYQEASSYYERTLALDPNYEVGYYNVASVYQNIAKVYIDEENAKLEADSNYKIQKERFSPTLEKAQAAYEKLRTFDRFKFDITALMSLANVYQILEKKDKLVELIPQIEAIVDESSIDTKLKEGYYAGLYKICEQIKDTERAKALLEKLPK